MSFSSNLFHLNSTLSFSCDILVSPHSSRLLSLPVPPPISHPSCPISEGHMSRGSKHLLLERVLVSAVLAILAIPRQKSTSRSLAPKRLARTWSRGTEAVLGFSCLAVLPQREWQSCTWWWEESEWRAVKDKRWKMKRPIKAAGTKDASTSVGDGTEAELSTGAWRQTLLSEGQVRCSVEVRGRWEDLKPFKEAGSSSLYSALWKKWVRSALKPDDGEEGRAVLCKNVLMVPLTSAVQVSAETFKWLTISSY